MKMLKHMALAAVTFGAVMGFLSLSNSVYAATVTWSGGGADGNWSTVGNWVGGVAPVNGDDVIINNAANFSNGSVVDIVGLSLISITFTNDAVGPSVTIELAEDITITSNINQAASVTSTTNIISAFSPAAHTITLGGNVAITSTAGGMSFGTSSAGDDFALNSNTLTFNDRGGTTAGLIVIESNITGNGSVVFNGAASDFQLWGQANTYTGTTQILANNLPVSVTDGSSFGASGVSIAAPASVAFNTATSVTISNAIAVAGNIGPASPTISFDASAPNVVFTVPNITLNSDTVMSADVTGAPTLQVNLAGITANGRCVQYLGATPPQYTNATANGFQNAPTGCVLGAATTGGSSPAAAAAPAAPNTGFKLLLANPLATFAGAILMAGAVIFTARLIRANRA